MVQKLSDPINAEVKRVYYEKITWIDIINLDAATISRLHRKFHFHPLDLEDCLSNQRPKIDEYENYLFIILHFPYLNNRTKRIEVEQVEIFIGNTFFITIHHEKLKILRDIFTKVKKSPRSKEEYMNKGTGFLLYEIVGRIFDSCFPLLDDLGKDILEIEQTVFSDDLVQRDMLKDILFLKKDIINFKRIILPQRTVISQLEHKNKKFLPADLEVYFDDVVDSIERIWNILQNHSELVESLQDSNESVISHNTNLIIKTLTIFSVVMMLLTLVSGIYGMNVKGLPWAEQPTAFYYVMGVMVAMLVGMLLYFRHKKWL